MKENKKQTKKQTTIWKDKHRKAQTDIYTCTNRHTEAGREIDRQTDRQTKI